MEASTFDFQDKEKDDYTDTKTNAITKGKDKDKYLCTKSQYVIGNVRRNSVQASAFRPQAITINAQLGPFASAVKRNNQFPKALTYVDI